ncbi:tetratricopeptide repeat protein [Zavarzinia compransoris]|uniref:Uncharacterized protein n=1 Tax=Zavarzinia compransoris TaxID=1264899 RepID=A0A317E0E8_9PROT|nr:tetratricopeptide repeat protein [Zavarzinia compransoris]PWR19914.1 hypothetical protein DKG75_15800 [Zavarzinia compransoris]TDP44971.1 tetratricopeptide repeat protein [Zavarzinia compransoris]
MNRILTASMLALALSLGGAFAPAFGAGTETGPASAETFADYAAGKAAVAAKDWATAIKHLTAVVDADPDNADAENLLGYSYRKSGNYEAAKRHYWQALKLDPDHRGAREYLGEAFLEQKNLAKAEEQLAELARICPAGCEERTELQQAIDAYKKANPGG